MTNIDSQHSDSNSILPCKIGSCTLTGEGARLHQASLQESRAGSSIPLSLKDLQPLPLTFDLPLTPGKQQRLFHRFPIQTQSLDETLEFRDRRGFGLICPERQSCLVALRKDLAKSTERLIGTGNEITLLQQTLDQRLLPICSVFFEKQPQGVDGAKRMESGAPLWREPDSRLAHAYARVG